MLKHENIIEPNWLRISFRTDTNYGILCAKQPILQQKDVI